MTIERFDLELDEEANETLNDRIRELDLLISDFSDAVCAVGDYERTLSDVANTIDFIEQQCDLALARVNMSETVDDLRESDSFKTYINNITDEFLSIYNIGDDYINWELGRNTKVVDLPYELRNILMRMSYEGECVTYIIEDCLTSENVFGNPHTTLRRIENDIHSINSEGLNSNKLSLDDYEDKLTHIRHGLRESIVGNGTEDGETDFDAVYENISKDLQRLDTFLETFLIPLSNALESDATNVDAAYEFARMALW